MKKVFILAIAMVFSVAGFAQSGFGIKAGLNFNTLDDIKTEDVGASFKAKTGFHAGLLYKASLPLGFTIQPELIYSQTTTGIQLAKANLADVKLSYLQLPVSIQWGIDLVMFRPFVQVSPYIGYNLSSKINLDKTIASYKQDFDANKLQYGIGFGAGLDIWKFQVSGRYCWDLGYVSDYSFEVAKDKIKNKEGKNRGFQLSVAYIF